DAAGNQLHFGSGTTGYTYTWDALSKLRSKESGDGSIEDYYLYTADDERINTLHWAESPIEETWTLRDLGGQVLRTWGTVGGSSGTWTHQEDHIHRDGQLLASWSPAEGLRFFHLDHLGTPRLITKADGRSAGLHTYFPFGEESVPNGSSERMKFTGHERDTHGTAGQGDDLDYMHARYCNPLNGRFLSVDPLIASADIRKPQSWNRYIYANNNPLLMIDPDGRNAKVTCVEQECTVQVRAQILVDTSDLQQVSAAVQFKHGAQNYWNNQSVTGSSGEAISFDVQFDIVSADQAEQGVDTLTVVPGVGRARVNMTLNLSGGESGPDTGTIFTIDNASPTSTGGLPAAGAHETGHLMGLRDLYHAGERVPWDPSPSVDIMRGGQITNGARSAAFVLSGANGNSVVTREKRKGH
ncbi:MAG: RHS repeat-associated core domain-containing protein, partial [Acidobacteriota bacterium]